MTQSGKYGDTPLGKSDEELREEGADALTNSERRRHAAVGSDETVPVLIPIAGTSAPAVVAADSVLPDAEERREES